MPLQVQFNYKHVLRDPSPYLFLLVPSLNQRAGFAREHSEHSFRVSRVLDRKRDLTRSTFSSNIKVYGCEKRKFYSKQISNEPAY